MSTIIAKACEECGVQSSDWGNWLVISKLKVKSAKSGSALVDTPEDTDFCSPGCLVRHVWKELEHASSHRVTSPAVPDPGEASEHTEIAQAM
jgi:hypothetical protein